MYLIRERGIGIYVCSRTARFRDELVAQRLVESEVDALGVITISRGCFERCCSKSNKKTPPYHSNLSFVALRNRRPTLLRASAYLTPSEASPRRRCGHASQFLWENELRLGFSEKRQIYIYLFIYIYIYIYIYTYR